MDARVHVGDQAQLLQFVQSLPDLGQQRSGSHRDDDLVGCGPIQLFHYLIGQRLGAFGVVRTDVDVHEGPSLLAGDLTAQAVNVIVVSFHLHHIGAIYKIAENFRRFQVVGNKHVALHLGSCGMRGHRVRQVPGRGARHGFIAELAGSRQRDGHHAILERKSRMIDRVVLDVERVQPQLVPEVLRSDQGRKAGMQADGGLAFNRQQVHIAPEALRAALDLLAREGGLNLLIVVLDLERPETQLTDMQRHGRIFFPALAADQAFHLGRPHGILRRF